MKLNKKEEAISIIEAGKKESILMNSNKLATKEFFETSIKHLQQLNLSNRLIELLNTFINV